jgi:hypothetical protein
MNRAVLMPRKTNGQLRCEAQLSRRSARLQLLHLRYVANVIAPRRRDARPFVVASLIALAVGPSALYERDQRARALSYGMRSTDQLDKNTHPSVPLAKIVRRYEPSSTWLSTGSKPRSSRRDSDRAKVPAQAAWLVCYGSS